MKKIGSFCLMMSLIVLGGCVCAPQKNMTGTSDLTLLTEEYPPVTFMKEGKVTGFVTDMVREIIARQGIADTIQLTSWDEAYKSALSSPNVVLFSAERTEKREKLFQWVGPVGKNSAIFYAKKGSGIKIKQPGRGPEDCRHCHDNRLVHRTAPEKQGLYQSGQFAPSGHQCQAAHERQGTALGLYRYYRPGDREECGIRHG